MKKRIHLQFFFAEMALRRISGINDSPTETLLEDLPLEDLFFNGSSRQQPKIPNSSKYNFFKNWYQSQPVDLNCSFLAIAPNTSHGLQIVGRIPVDIVEDQPGSAN